MAAIVRQALVEVAQPLRVDEGFQDAPHFKLMLLSAQAIQKSQFDDLVQVRRSSE